MLLLDLNGFKQINDTHGHRVGDEVFKQFAGELKAAFRATDMVARWGGDEFVVILDCSIREARSHIERLAQWVFGEYTIRAGGKALKVHVDAAVGAAAWQPGKSTAALLERVDAAMYEQKSRCPRPSGNPASGNSVRRVPSAPRLLNSVRCPESAGKPVRPVWGG